MEPPKTAKKTTDPAAKPRSRTSARRATLSPSPKSAGKAPTDDALARQAALGLITSATSALEALSPPAPPVVAALLSELNNIDFSNMIGGPLQAAVDAQVASSLATVNFINTVGFKAPASGSSGAPELIMVDFSHTRNTGTDAAPIMTPVVLKVPLLAMLQIPSLRIEHVIIDFNVKLNSVETSSASSDLGISGSVGGGGKRVNFKVSPSYQRKATTGVEVKKEYALNVNVKAVQDEIPAGLEKILNMLAS